MFKFKINTTGVDLSGYKFIVKASNTNNFETDKTTADVTYTYQLYSQSDIDAVTFTTANDPTLVKSAYALKMETNVSSVVLLYMMRLNLAWGYRLKKILRTSIYVGL